VHEPAIGTIAQRKNIGAAKIMYLSHFGLQEKPFKTGTDPQFLWLGAKHRDALATLVRNILEESGFNVVAGDVGTGKTTFANALLDELGDRAVAAKVTCSDVAGVDFLKLISKAYGLGGGMQGREAFHDQFSAFFRKSFSLGKKVVLIIDDAHRLTDAYLAELFDLSDVRENGAQMLSIVFVGLDEFKELLRSEANRSPERQVAFSYSLEPLTRDETAQYVAYRVNAAHCERELFTPESIDEIFSYSSGVPLLINRVCELSLSRTFFKGEETIRPETVRECAKLLHVPERKAASARDQSALPQGMEATAGSIPDIKLHGDAGERIAEKGLQKPHRARVVVAAVIGFLAVSIGFTLFLMPDNPPDSAKVEVKKEEIPAVSPSAEGTTAPSAQMGEGSEPSAGQESPAVSGEDKTGARKNRRETAGLRSSAEKARQAPAERARRGKVPEREAEEGDAAVRSAEDGGTASREPARQGAEEMESGKVIDWLIKKRSE
jgi:type II secretory pathway predicted ATPase ExeA